MPSISAAFPRCQPVCSSAEMICCFSTSRNEPDAESVAESPATDRPAPDESGGAENGIAPFVLRATSGGSSFTVIRPSFESRIARSRQLRSCRTLPGQL